MILRVCKIGAMMWFIALPHITHAAETITYTYDANGRLVQAVTSGGTASGVQDIYTYDAADNIATRASTSVTPRPTGVIIVPLNGYTIIPIYN
jgi:YD repeat-containing protein